MVQMMDRYAQITPKTLVVVQELDRYEHCTHLPPTVLWLERAYRWKKEWKGQKEGWTGRHWRQASRLDGATLETSVSAPEQQEDRGGQTRRLRSGSSAPALLSRRAEGPRMDVAGVEAPGRS